jgi:hypothetical protein
MIHRATCPAIKSAPSRRFHWTAGAKLKACSLDREELAAWVAEQAVAKPACAQCRPDCDDEALRAKDAHPSKLGREILDYILDAAAIHLEHEYPPFFRRVWLSKHSPHSRAKAMRLCKRSWTNCNPPDGDHALGDKDCVASSY